jgi:hypothetical protein
MKCLGLQVILQNTTFIARTHINTGILILRFCVYYSKYTYWDVQNILSSKNQLSSKNWWLLLLICFNIMIIMFRSFYMTFYFPYWSHYFIYLIFGIYILHKSVVEFAEDVRRCTRFFGRQRILWSYYFLIIFLWINLIINLVSHFEWLLIYFFRIFHWNSTMSKQCHTYDKLATFVPLIIRFYILNIFIIWIYTGEAEATPNDDNIIRIS